MYSDPTGHSITLACIIIGAVIGAVAGGCAGAYVSKKQTTMFVFQSQENIFISQRIFYHFTIFIHFCHILKLLQYPQSASQSALFRWPSKTHSPD